MGTREDESAVDAQAEGMASVHVIDCSLAHLIHHVSGAWMGRSWTCTEERTWTEFVVGTVHVRTEAGQTALNFEFQYQS
jgi:hypothetical protein